MSKGNITKVPKTRPAKPTAETMTALRARFDQARSHGTVQYRDADGRVWIIEHHETFTVRTADTPLIEVTE